MLSSNTQTASLPEKGRGKCIGNHFGCSSEASFLKHCIKITVLVKNSRFCPILQTFNKQTHQTTNFKGDELTIAPWCSFLGPKLYICDCCQNIFSAVFYFPTIPMGGTFPTPLNSTQQVPLRHSLSCLQLKSTFELSLSYGT